MQEIHRVLKPDKAVGWVIADQWIRKKFTPTGFLLYERLQKYFDPIDIVCLPRHNQTSNTKIWYSRARQYNFYLRGFKYLFIMKKTDTPQLQKTQLATTYLTLNNNKTAPPH